MVVFTAIGLYEIYLVNVQRRFPSTACIRMSRLSYSTLHSVSTSPLLRSDPSSSLKVGFPATSTEEEGEVAENIVCGKFGQPLGGDLPGRVACSELLNVFYGPSLR
jgi:hypothetical protein